MASHDYALAAVTPIASEQHMYAREAQEARRESLSEPGARSWCWFLLKAGTLMALFEYGYQIARNTWIERLIVDRMTVTPAALSINALFQFLHSTSDHLQVFAFERRIIGEGVALDISAGCEGVEGLFLILSAVIAYPAPLRNKLVGALIGSLLMYSLNQLRLLALFVVLSRHSTWFESLHAVIAPTFTVAVGGLFFAIWTSAANNCHVRT